MANDSSKSHRRMPIMFLSPFYLASEDPKGRRHGPASCAGASVSSATSVNSTLACRRVDISKLDPVISAMILPSVKHPTGGVFPNRDLDQVPAADQEFET